jgi:hypothetical protein
MWFTESNALAKSQNSPLTDNLPLSASKALFIRLYVATSVDYLVLKPYCSWARMLLTSMWCLILLKITFSKIFEKGHQKRYWSIIRHNCPISFLKNSTSLSWNKNIYYDEYVISHWFLSSDNYISFTSQLILLGPFYILSYLYFSYLTIIWYYSTLVHYVFQFLHCLCATSFIY